MSIRSSREFFSKAGSEYIDSSQSGMLEEEDEYEDEIQSSENGKGSYTVINEGFMYRFASLKPKKHNMMNDQLEII